MTTEEKLADVTWQMEYHEKEAEHQLVKAAAFRLLKEELERTLTCDAVMQETKATVNEALDAIASGLQ